ncbi:SDR family NAD(P)-dependent oxidoreductase [Sneathiella chinensis]|uniref:Short-chain type dehydrogenase/reductase n=1 Tax=Sneathiella chinensis TaxID=349750 RepID=A0ABQ5U748_9PROT|nr:SDR family NAD(P)-dependent oxidoreductase [Sneathiella chinensis]GLQ07550.1 short-chain type dehydrogenase/reductase [Sneathiella chinensis]
MKKNLTGKRVILTGAASGIGQQLALTLAARGAELALSDINETELQDTAAQLTHLGAPRFRTDRLDVSDTEATRRYAELIQAEFGPADLVINNAGLTRVGPFADVELSSLEHVMEVDFWGVVRMSKAFLPQLIATKGHLVNISSLFGLIGYPGQAGYCAAKHAVKGFSESLAIEMSPHGVTVTSVHPGGVRTNIIRKSTIDAPMAGVRNKEQMARSFDQMAETSAADAAAIIVRGIENGKERILVGRDAVIISLLQRLMPQGYKRLLMKVLWKQGRKKPAEPRPA